MGWCRARFLISLSLVGLGFAGLLFFTLDNFSVYFYTPEEAVKQANQIQKQQIRIGGMVVQGSVNRSLVTESVSFMLSDLKGTEIAVSFKGVPPDMFKEKSGVIVEGVISADGYQFEAKNLLVKHSQEYKAPTASHPQIDPKLIERSLLN